MLTSWAGSIVVRASISKIRVSYTTIVLVICCNFFIIQILNPITPITMRTYRQGIMWELLLIIESGLLNICDLYLTDRSDETGIAVCTFVFERKTLIFWDSHNSHPFIVFEVLRAEKASSSMSLLEKNYW